MSKSVKQSIFILIFLLIGSLVFSGISLMQKEEVQKEKEKLVTELNEKKQELQEVQGNIKSLEASVSALKSEKVSLETEKDEIALKIEAAENEIEKITNEIESVNRDKDKWKSRLDSMTTERDELVVKLKAAQEPKIVYKDKIVYKEREPEPEQQEVKQDVPKFRTDMPPTLEEDKYWAGVLKEKAELQISVDQLKKELAENSLEIISLKQSNADLQIELDNISKDREKVNINVSSIKDKYEREIEQMRYDLEKVKEAKGALINSLSLELARTKNDTKYIRNQSDKVTSENKELRSQLQQLVATKGELEKTIVHLERDKVDIEKRLEEREGMIQAKIHEIWQIKESLDETFGSAPLMKNDEEKVVVKQEEDSGVDLQPIRIVSNDTVQEVVVPVKVSPGYEGKVISINEENNFVIVDIGEDDGLTLGETLGVYRNAEHVATLEVIQIRKDICAADVKEVKEKIKQGDKVR